MSVENLPNYYQLLHVQTDAPEPVIKASYRAMMQKMRLHPDLGGDEVLAQQLNEAVRILCNTGSREQYDKWLAENKVSEIPPGGRPNGERYDSEAKNYHAAQSNDTSGQHADNAYSSKSDAYRSSSTSDSGSRAHLPTRKQCLFCHAGSATSVTGVTGYQRHNRCAQCKGATTPIENISMGSADDVRQIYRHTHESQVWLHNEWPLKTAISATMTDLSTAGCAIQCTHALPLQSVIMLDTPMFNSICQVRYLKQQGPPQLYNIGLEFHTLDMFASPGSVFSATA